MGVVQWPIGSQCWACCLDTCGWCCDHWRLGWGSWRRHAWHAGVSAERRASSMQRGSSPACWLLRRGGGPGCAPQSPVARARVPCPVQIGPRGLRCQARRPDFLGVQGHAEEEAEDGGVGGSGSLPRRWVCRGPLLLLQLLLHPPAPATRQSHAAGLVDQQALVAAADQVWPLCLMRCHLYSGMHLPCCCHHSHPAASSH
mmetsp:Transcript_3639/g.9813  ORF Transcript_3639/g.9813 Transcript_3639/m.9813 type:complete len:200 (-) Transcript_3639:1481-2080(-)